MSTRATIFISDDNQHWHRELCAKGNWEMNTEDNQCMVLEFGPDCRVEDFGEEGFVVLVPSDSPVFKILDKTRFSEDGQK